jgi:hypothetical protein
MRRIIVGVLLLAVACGPAMSPAARASPSAPATMTPGPSQTPTAGPPGPLLFAALEAKNGAQQGSWNTIAIAGLDGYARAKTSFMPIPMPFTGCFVPIMPPSAHVAAGGVYFADGAGVIRSLSPHGEVKQITTLPRSSGRQMLSFAVSPDGSRLLGVILTLPSTSTYINRCAAGPSTSGHFFVDVYAARPGEAAVLLYHQDLGVQTRGGGLGPQALQLYGWDQIGPIGVFPAPWDWPGGVLAFRHFGPLVRVDPDTGRVRGPVSGTSCDVQDNLPNADYTCALQSMDISVRHSDGTEIWHWSTPPTTAYFLDLLAPDEAHIAAYEIGKPSEILGRDRSHFNLPNNYWADGWLDSSTLVGGGSYGAVLLTAPFPNFYFVKLGSPTSQVDIGFRGLFVGSMQS